MLFFDKNTSPIHIFCTYFPLTCFQEPLKRELSTVGGSTSYLCSFEDCKGKELLPVICPQCEKHFCLAYVYIYTFFLSIICSVQDELTWTGFSASLEFKNFLITHIMCIDIINRTIKLKSLQYFDVTLQAPSSR